jgi:hypothetical protein
MSTIEGLPSSLAKRPESKGAAGDMKIDDDLLSSSSSSTTTTTTTTGVERKDAPPVVLDRSEASHQESLQSLRPLDSLAEGLGVTDEELRRAAAEREEARKRSKFAPASSSGGTAAASDYHKLWDEIAAEDDGDHNGDDDKELEAVDDRMMRMIGNDESESKAKAEWLEVIHYNLLYMTCISQVA